MVPGDIRCEEIETSKSEEMTIVRQEIRPRNQSGIASLFSVLFDVLRKGRFTGKVTVNLNQGGVRDIVTEQKIDK